MLCSLPIFVLGGNPSKNSSQEGRKLYNHEEWIFTIQECSRLDIARLVMEHDQERLVSIHEIKRISHVMI